MRRGKGQGPGPIPIGASHGGRELLLHANFRVGDRDALSRPDGTLLIGGTHGDERATVDVLHAFVEAALGSSGIAAPVAVLALHNPDGHDLGSRYNARGVDLNRNFPHRWDRGSAEPPGESPLSEPEARALHDFILERRPRKIISLHWALAEIDADGPQSGPLAEAMWNALTPAEQRPYRLRLYRPELPALGFCPGSLGQWAGHGLVYGDGVRPAMITLELPYGADGGERSEPLPEDHLDRVQAIWRDRRSDYLRSVGEPVLRMLAAACSFGHHPPRRADFRESLPVDSPDAGPDRRDSAA